jgi:hypothetical protein
MLLASCGWLAASGELVAAQVESVLAGKDAVVLKVSKKELAGIAVGRALTLKVDGKDGEIDAEVTGVEGNKVRVKVLFGIAQLAPGQSVQLGADGGASRPVAASGAAAGLGFPYVFTGRFYGRYDQPASQLAGLSGNAFTAYLGKDTRSATIGGAAKARSSFDGLAYGLTPVAALPRGVRLGLSYDQEEGTERLRVNGTTKRDYQLASVTAQVGALLMERYAVGLKLGSRKLRINDDPRGAGGRDVERGGESFTDVRPSVGIVTKSYELHAEFRPKIDVGSGGTELARPATLALQYRRQLAETRTLAADLVYAQTSGVDDGSKDAFSLRGGCIWSEPGLPVLGALLGVTPAHAKSAETAMAENVNELEGTVFVDQRTDAGTHLGFEVDVAAVDGKTDGGSVKGQTLAYQAVFAKEL